MDIFEKQQTIEAIRTVIKARWLYVSVVAFQGVIAKLWFPQVPLPSGYLMSFVVIGTLFINFLCWLVIKQQPEKISNFGLRFIKFSQVPLDVFGISAIIYFSGTANKMLMIMYLVPIMEGTILFKVRGIALSTLFVVVLYTGLVALEYYGLMPKISPEAASQSPGKLLGGEPILTQGQIIGFNLYIIASAIYAGYLAGLFKRREGKLQIQKQELVEQTKILTLQTQELTQAKDQLQGALVISDVARRAATQARNEMEKANTELQKKIDELEKFYKITVGREVRMVELKSQIKDLKDTIKKLDEELSGR